MKKMIILLSILMLVSLILSGCTDVNIPDISDDLTKKMTIVNFTVTPSIIELGDTANLSWVVTGSDTMVNIDNGIGEVSLTGYRIISPTESTTYKLSAKNGTSTKDATTQIMVIINTNEENNNQTVLTVEELVQNSDSYFGKKITVDGFYFISNDGPSLIPATTVLTPNPTTWIKLDETSLNSAKQKANITIASNLKYRVVGVLQQIPLPVGFDIKIIVESIKVEKPASPEESKFIGEWIGSDELFTFEDNLFSKDCGVLIIYEGNGTDLGMALQYDGTWKVEDNTLIINGTIEVAGKLNYLQDVYTYQFSNNNQNLHLATENRNYDLTKK